MAEEKQLPEHVFTALEENNKILNTLAQEKEKTAKKEDNVVATPKVNSSLTSDEKARYANIGAELFKPVLSSLEKLIKKEKKKNEMLIKDDAETIFDFGFSVILTHIEFTICSNHSFNTLLNTLFDTLLDSQCKSLFVSDFMFSVHQFL